MDAKERLSTYRKARQTYDISKREAEAIETMLTSSAIDYSKVIVQTSPSDWTETLARLVDLHNQCVKQMQECINTMQDVKTLIDNVDDTQLKEILSRRYLLLELWEDISAEMHLDERWIYRLHDRALSIVQEIIDQ